MQQEWKTLGPAPRRHEHGLWKRLRTAADAIFERRRAQTAARDEERRAAQTAREVLCQQLETLAASDPAVLQAAQGQLAELTQAWANAPSLPREELVPLTNRFQRAMESCQQGIVTHRVQQEACQLAAQRQAGELCSELEALAEQPGDQGEAVTIMKQRWAYQPMAPSPALVERFHRACGLALTNPTQRIAVFTAASVAAELEILAIRLEILAGLESPPEAARARLEYQVNRLASGLGQGSNQTQGANQLRELELYWYTLGPVPASQRTGLEARLEKVRASLH